MAIEKDLELLDSFIGNRLNAEEQGAFEQKLNADPELKREYNLQHKIVEGIRKARITELKTMLNNVPVAPTSANEALSLSKVLIGIVIVGAISSGLYFYFNQDESLPQQEIVTSQPLVETENTPVVESTEASDAEIKNSLEQAAVSSDQPAKNNEALPVIPKKEGTAVEQERATAPKMDVYDPGEEATVNREEENLDIRKGTASTKEKIEVTTESNNKKYKFHYQFKEGKLFLYGSFKKDLYEIMEFFSDDNKRTAFLYYENNYYLLNEENEKIKPLTAIADQVLLKKLKDYRGN